MSFSHNDDFKRSNVLKDLSQTALNGTGVVGALTDGPVLRKHTASCAMFQAMFHTRICAVPPKEIASRVGRGDLPKDFLVAWEKCLPWPGLTLSCPRDSGPNPTGLPNGAVVDVVGGAQYAGEVVRRRLVVGAGQPVFLAAGNYDTFRVNIVTIAAGASPVRMCWVDGSAANVAFPAFLQAPAIVSAGALAETNVPEGAVKVLSTGAVTIVQRDYSGGGGVAVAFVQAVAAGDVINVVGQTIQTSGATTLRFFLAPV